MDNTDLYVLDSYGLIYRAYYAFINKPLVNASGDNVSAVFGFFRVFHSILKNHQPRYIAAAFDSRKPTFRHEMYPAYKAQRMKTPEDLYAQIPVIEEILTVLGIPILRQDGYEADDVIATLAAACRKQGHGIRILSGDKDLMQLVDGTSFIMRPDKSGGWETVDAEGVTAEWGVPPALMLDLLSLTGDASDNIPGVKGVGEKTACKLLGQYGSLDGIYQHADEIPGAMGKKIVEGRDSAYLSRQLVTLFTEVPVDTNIEHFTLNSPDYDAAARLLFRAGVPKIAQTYSPGISLQGEISLSAKGKNAPENGELDLFSSIESEP
ncbi:MAG: DNA polymerase I, partial [Spirochaetaceae bacterium]|nr:DNA polymerase I [Spirochaetaceae bacterium]